jgi:ADP-heptose:LPS heptosyltransferase
LKSLLRALRRTGNRIAAGVLEGSVRTAAALSPSLSERPREPKSIFVLRNNDLGDLLVVTPLFEALRRRFPEAWIAAGVGDWSRDVLAGNPHLSEVLPINAPWFNKYQKERGPLGRFSYLRRSPEIRTLTERRFEVGIDVLGSAWGSYLLLRAGIPYRLGVRGYAGGHSAVQAAVGYAPGEHVGRSALRFAELLGATDLPPVRPQIFLSATERAQGERWWASAEVDGRRRRLVIAPGGGAPEKCWPAESFAALAAGLSDVPDLSILVLGGPRESALTSRVAAASPRARTFSEAPDLREVFALLAACDFVVCNSSMPMHAAAAFGKRMAVLLGPSFHSASQHQAQWGYPGLSITLGRDREHRDICTYGEALAAIRPQLEGVRFGSGTDTGLAAMKRA